MRLLFAAMSLINALIAIITYLGVPAVAVPA
jgi:hypothetical protein